MGLMELRAMLNEGVSVNESIDDYILDEAYFGTSAVDPILHAIEAIELAVKANPNINLNRDSLNDNLCAAVKQIFGFKKVRIYWSNNPGIGSGPFTITNSTILHTGSAPLMYGTHANGFYDANSELSIFINMDNQLFTLCGLTSKETTAILLHEIGHNFDYSIYNIVNAWSQVIFILSIIVNYGSFKMASGQIQKLLVETFGKEYANEIFGTFYNFPNIIANLVPPLGVLIRGFQSIKFNIKRFLSNLFAPVTILLNIPLAAILTPVKWMNNLFSRKKEVYADSFAASYGYASELATGLDKLDKTLSGVNAYPEGSFMSVLADITLLNRDIVCLASGVHTTTQRRLIKMMDKLEKDIINGKYDSELKDDLKRQLRVARETYNMIIGLDENKKTKFTSYMRQTLDNWYAGKPYMIFSALPDEYAE